MIYRFDDCLLDSDRRELRRGGIACQIEPQVFDLLHLLIVNRERVLSREDIFKIVWRERIVSESVLGNRINAARAAIGDNGAEQRTIRTLRRKGFRFIGAVTEEPERSKIGDPVVIKPGKPSLAVLFMMSELIEEQLTFVSKAFADDLTVALARSRSFDVVAHNRICTEETELNQISRELGVSYLIICATRKVGGQTRLNVRLVDACSSIHIWARSFTRDRNPRLPADDAITARIAAAIEPHIFVAQERRQRRKPFNELSTDEYFTKAVTVTRQRTRRNYDIAQSLLARAIEREPDCGRAHSLSAYYFGLQVLWGWKPRSKTIPLAIEAANKAVVIDESDSWAHFALGWALTQNRSPEAGVESYRKAIAINPYFQSAYSCLGIALSYVGEIEQALAVLDDGERLDAPEIFFGLAKSARAAVYASGEKPSHAMKAARLSIQQGPGLVASLRHLVANCALTGEMDEARVAFKAFMEIVPNASLESIAVAVPYIHDSHLNRMLDGFRLVGLR